MRLADFEPNLFRLHIVTQPPIDHQLPSGSFTFWRIFVPGEFCSMPGILKEQTSSVAVSTLHSLRYLMCSAEEFKCCVFDRGVEECRLKWMAGCVQFCCCFSKCSSSGENKLTPISLSLSLSLYIYIYIYIYIYRSLYQGLKTRNIMSPHFPWSTFTDSNIVPQCDNNSFNKSTCTLHYTQILEVQ